MTDPIYIFTVVKQGVFGSFGTGILFKSFTRRILVINDATHVVKSTSNIMTSLFGVA